MEVIFGLCTAKIDTHCLFHIGNINRILHYSLFSLLGCGGVVDECERLATIDLPLGVCRKHIYSGTIKCPNSLVS